MPVNELSAHTLLDALGSRSVADVWGYAERVLGELGEAVRKRRVDEAYGAAHAIAELTERIDELEAGRGG